MRKPLVILLSLLCTACTFSSMTVTMKDGSVVKVRHIDFHPGGNAVDATAKWDDVGELNIKRDTSDSSDSIEAVAEGVTNAVLR